MQAAKSGLASLIQRQRSEEKQISVLEGRVTDLTGRAKAALEGRREALATEAAEAIAEMENELALRRETVMRLEARVMRLRRTVETTNRRIIDLKQGAIAARAVRQEQTIQTRIQTTLSGKSPMAEAEDLIAEVLNRDDPYEQAEILEDIDRGLSKADLGDRMAAEGFGRPTKMTAAEVLNRLRSEQ